MADPTIVEAIGAIVTRRWGPCDDYECESATGEECTAWRGTVADVLDAAAEAGYPIGATLTRPGRWELPAEPGAEVGWVWDRDGKWHHRHPDFPDTWVSDFGWLRGWSTLVAERGPLSATPPETAERRPCGNEREPDGDLCTGTLTFNPGGLQAKCPVCGGWEGVHAPRRTPPETAERTVDHCLNCNGTLVERDGRRVHRANGERACPSPVTAGGGQV